FFTCRTLLCILLSKTYLFSLIISVREFENRLEATVNLLSNGCCKLFRLISKVNVRLCIRGRTDPRQLIRQEIESQAILFVIGDQEVLILRIASLFPVVPPHECL